MKDVSLIFADQINTLLIIAIVALVPFVFILMTSFTRISIVLTFLRQALNTSVPSMQIIIGLSLILTGYVMHPVFSEIQKKVRPDVTNEIHLQKIALAAWPPLRDFMLFNTREKDLELFLDLGSVELTANLPESVPWYSLIPAFVISELRCAFMLGFLLFLPFLVIDMVVSSLLMSMGMLMVPPILISFPFKLLLFIVVDGWRLLVQQIVTGYQMS